MPPTVSVNLCCYNSEKYLEETLQSVFAQTYKDWELVIINDGSTDSTEQIVQKYIAEGWPIMYHSQANAGLGNARNKAISLSSGQLIALIDHDDLWAAHKLETQVSAFTRDARLGLVYCDGEFIDQHGRPLMRHSAKYPPARGDVFDHLLLASFIPPTAAVMRRAVLDDVGVFPAFSTAEEYDLFLRIAYAYPVECLEELLYKYRLHPENLTRTGSREALYREVLQIRLYWLERLGSGGMRGRTLRRLAAQAHGGYGVWLLEGGRTAEARRHLAASLRLAPFQFRYLHYGLACLPPRLLPGALASIDAVRGPVKRWRRSLAAGGR